MFELLVFEPCMSMGWQWMHVIQEDNLVIAIHAHQLIGINQLPLCCGAGISDCFRGTAAFHRRSEGICNGLGGTELILSSESMEVILWELIENSKKFHPRQDPEISIDLSKLDELDLIKMTIIDNGSNLTQEQLKHLWHPYYQSEKSFTGEIEGMGLGLATVASVLWSVGGKLDVQNREDGEPGIEASLFLPIAKKV
ncbi:MAG: ATP-binding protein [Chloroflexota bacterium]